MKTYCLFIFFNTAVSLCLWAQSSLEDYLQVHAQAVSLDFQEDLSIPSLDTSLASYRFFISGEFHGVSSNHKIKFKLLKYLHQKANVRYLIIESGYSSAFLLNQFLANGDTTLLCGYYLAEKVFWQHLRTFNQTLSEDEQVQVIGIDFERDEAFLKAMKLLLPATQPPQAIGPGIVALRQLVEDSITGDKRVKIIKAVQKNLKRNSALYENYFKENYIIFRKIIDNPVPLTPRTKRDKFAYKNMLEEYHSKGGGNYYAQYGISHVNLTFGNIAGLLNAQEDSPFKSKVLVLMPLYINCMARHKNEVWEADGFGLLRQAGIKNIDEVARLFHDNITFIDLRFMQNYPKLKNSAHFMMLVKNQPSL